MLVCFLTSFSLFISACSSLNGSSNLVNNPFASDHYFLTQNQGNIFSLAKKVIQRRRELSKKINRVNKYSENYTLVDKYSEKNDQVMNETFEFFSEFFNSM